MNELPQLAFERGNQKIAFIPTLLWKIKDDATYPPSLKVIIPFIFQAAALLAAFTHPSHIVIYAPGDSFTCRRAATRNLLGIA
ncbi:hypothetical protein C5468_20830 [Photorhabdus luminescens subsp. mexicana]|uniref:Uncharacterized protein n=1 Tax=Photorhabdus luminescens subsp. mexicana TaxID=2100167 RepID=A0A4R4IWX7_PHOLU|nr:hypothetical protein C5468_20830 [Photorhabdus luminescens subsp. mexicana]